MPVIIDCNFQDQLTDKEMQSLAIQIGYCHHVNKSFEKPTKLTITGYRDRLKQKLERNHCDNWGIELLEKHYLDYYPKDKLVYLSGDAKEELKEIDPT
jgi:tRNA (guanine9-N1)-methyltransferase